MTSAFNHTPVLLPETLAALQPVAGGRYIDATVGGAGHAEKVLELSSPTGTLLGIDADPAALSASALRLERFGTRFTSAEAYFDELEKVAHAAGFAAANGILFDLGLSSHQIDVPLRGFSFAQDGPLDMRFGPGAARSASDLVNTLPATELQTLFREYGEERFARRVSERIAHERRQNPINTTGQLANLVARCKPRIFNERIHPATRIFQALRIAVNDELGRLERALPQARDLLDHGGRLAVITFHSLEDRLVKRFMREEARGCICPPEVPVCVCGHTPSLRVLTPRPTGPSAEEVASNPRARSAKLRVAERVHNSHSRIHYASGSSR